MPPRVNSETIGAKGIRPDLFTLTDKVGERWREFVKTSEGRKDSTAGGLEIENGRFCSFFFSFTVV